MSRPAFFRAVSWILIACGAAAAWAGEAHPVRVAKLDSSQVFQAGQVAGLFGGGLSLSTAGADRVVVVAADPAAGETDVAIALSGELAVPLLGPVRAGDLVFTSGRNDGSATGLPPGEIAPARLAQLVGRALEAHPVNQLRAIRVLVGGADWAIVAEMLEARDALLEAQELELVELRERLAAITDQMAAVESLRIETERLVALEAARAAEELAPLPLDTEQR